MTSLIQLKGVSKYYDMAGERYSAINGIDLTIEKNEYIACIGPSGSGKSTLMNILGCLDKPSAGRYLLKGNDISESNDDELALLRNQEIGFVFQNFQLLPRLTAIENVMLPLVYRGTRLRERMERARDALASVGLSHRERHLPNQLSGGQRQRVAIARALCARPSLLLADEPTGNLDSSTATEIMALFDLLHQQGNTLVLVTHSEEVAARCLKRIRMLDGIIQAGHLDLDS